MPIILLFILILNIVSIVLMYYSLGDLGKKEKLIYIVVGTAVMYIITSIVYWFSTRGIEVTEVSERGKDLITFLFVPINGIIILPLLAKSYSKLKYGNLDKSEFLKRGIVLAVILLIVLIIECMYFKNIQQQVVNMLNAQENVQQDTVNNNVKEDIESLNTVNANSIDENTLIQNTIIENSLNDNTLSASNSVETNDVMANESIENQISTNVVNGME